MPTRKDVAKLAGVSTATVSNVYTGKNVVSKDLRHKVLEAAETLKYVPNFTARNLRLGCSSNIGITLNEPTNPFHMEIINGIENYAMKHGYIVTVFMLDNHVHNKIEQIEQRQLDALINYTTHEYPTEFIEMLRRRKTLLVNFGEDLGMTFAHRYYHATYACLKRLAELGHEKIAYISTVDRIRFFADERGQAYSDAVRELGLCADDKLLFFNDNYDLKSDTIGYMLGKKMLASDCGATAILAMNDLAAMGAMGAIFNAGLRIPEDISVVGCDNISFSNYYHPSLSSIGCDTYKLGNRLAKEIITKLETKDNGIGYSYSEEFQPVFRDSIAKRK